MGKSFTIDWTNKVFNNCKILSPVFEDKRTCDNKWNVVCYCGKEFWARPSDLKRGKVPSCGCNRSDLARKQMVKTNYFNYVNEFGIVLLYPKIKEKIGSLDIWIASCPRHDIPILFETIPKSILNNNVKSCGCLHKQKASENISNYLKVSRKDRGLDENKFITDEMFVIIEMTFGKIKYIIKKIDCYTCAVCLKRNGPVEVHHIEPVGKFNFKNQNEYLPLYDINNLVSLCRTCHIQIAHDGFGMYLNQKIKNELLAIVTMRKITTIHKSEYDEVVQSCIIPWLVSHIQEYQ